MSRLAGAEDCVAVAFDRFEEVVDEQEVVVNRNAAVAHFAGALSAMVDRRFGPRFIDDQGAFFTDDVELDLAQVGVARAADSAHANGGEGAALQGQREAAQIVNVVVGVELVEVAGGACEHTRTRAAVSMPIVASG